MSTIHDTRLPDPVYGSADANVVDHHKLRVSSSLDGSTLLHAHLGGVYVGMSERNWRALFAALGQLDIVAAPVVTHRITMDDENGTATISSEVTA